MSEYAKTLLRKYKMDPDDIDYNAVANLYTCEALKKLNGHTSSLLMAPSYINISSKGLHKGEKAIAVDAGGTNVRVGVVELDEKGSPIMLSQKKYLMSDMAQTHKAKDFFDNLAEVILPFCTESENIGVSFAFPGVITESKDLIIESMCKEIIIDDISQKSFRAGLYEALSRRNVNNPNITVINDTVACLLGAAGVSAINKYGACVGLVLGTGMNTSVKLKRSLVPYAGYSDKGGCDLINTESGMLCFESKGLIDKQIDIESQLPKDHLFEKTVSGKYLALIIEKCVAQLELDNALPKGTSEKYKALSGEAVSDILSKKTDNETDETVKYVAQRIALRAAKLLAASISAAVLMYGEQSPALIVTEGSTINKVFGLKELLEAELNKKLLFDNNIKYDIISVNDAVMKGVAVSALL